MGSVLAIDAGTSGVRTLVVDEADGHIVDFAARPLPQHFPHPGWVEHEPMDIWHLVAETLQEVDDRLTAPHLPVAALGITNQRETAIAWDRRTGMPLHRALVWQDRRTAARCEQLHRDGALPLVRERTGLVLDPYFSATKYEWLLTEVLGDDTAQATWLSLGTVDTWLLWQLTGGPDSGIFATDATNASRTLLFDTTAREWSDELCDLFGVPRHALAEVQPSAGHFGTVAAGLPFAGTPISGIAGDQQAALFGQRCTHHGDVKVTYGTGSFVLANAGPLPPPPPDGLLSTVAWDLGDHGDITYALEGANFASGAAIQWLRDGLELIDEAAAIGPLATSVPDAGGVTVVPAFTGLGSPWWDPAARGTVVGITRGTSRAHLARAVIDAMAFQVRDIVDAMAAATGTPAAELRVDGGASVMDLLLQTQADCLQTVVTRPAVTESTALGAAMLAGLATGVWSMTDLDRLRTSTRRTTPAVTGTLADLAYRTWLAAVERSRNWEAAR